MYKLTASANVIQRLADGALIPLPPGESAGYEYAKWRSAGNTPQPYVALAPQVPAVVTIKQAHKALLAAGLLDAVEAHFATMPRLTQIDWQKSTTLERHNATLNAAAASLGLSSAQVDALFRAAAAL